MYNESSFAAAFCVVLAVSAYLPAADLFALLPLASLLPRTGGEAGCMLDFDLQKQVRNCFKTNKSGDCKDELPAFATCRQPCCDCP